MKYKFIIQHLYAIGKLRKKKKIDVFVNQKKIPTSSKRTTHLSTWNHIKHYYFLKKNEK